MATLSSTNPIAILHLWHSKPRTALVLWSWSTANLLFMGLLSLPHIAHLKFCCLSISLYSSRVIPYRRLKLFFWSAWGLRSRYALLFIFMHSPQTAFPLGVCRRATLWSWPRRHNAELLLFCLILSFCFHKFFRSRFFSCNWFCHFIYSLFSVLTMRANLSP